MNAHQWLSGLLDVAGSRPVGGRVRQCPAHADGSPSLAVKEGADGRALLHCHAGCTVQDILAVLHCARIRLFTPPPVTPAAYASMVGLSVIFPPVVLRTGHPATRGFRLEAVHDYGPALLERWRDRAGHKELIWATRLADGTTVPGLIGVTLDALPLYREREVWQATALGEPVLLVESESSCDALRGWYATTWAGGAPALNLRRLAEVLGDYPHTIVVPDHDQAGLRCLVQLRDAGLAPHVVMPAPGEDARDLYMRLGPDRFTAAITNRVRTEVAA